MSNYNGVWFTPPAPVAHVTLRDVDGGGAIDNVPRTGMMLNSTKDNVDELVSALDTALAIVTGVN